jgi:hypothetical protein
MSHKSVGLHGLLRRCVYFTFLLSDNVPNGRIQVDMKLTTRRVSPGRLVWTLAAEQAKTDLTEVGLCNRFNCCNLSYLMWSYFRIWSKSVTSSTVGLWPVILYHICTQACIMRVACLQHSTYAITIVLLKANWPLCYQLLRTYSYESVLRAKSLQFVISSVYKLTQDFPR